MFRRIAKLLREKSGVATSLLEATATIAVGATLAGAAITVVTDKVQQARIAATAQDVQMIGDAINNFEKDNGFYPIFKTAGTLNELTAPDPGLATPWGTVGGGARSAVNLLESANGDQPELGTTDTGAGVNNPGLGLGEATKRPFAHHATVVGWDEAASALVDTIENQLSENGPGYVVRGASLFDPKRGWNGPYMAKVPPTDGWGNKFKVNALYLDDHGVSDGDTNPYMTFILSAGPNENIQTFFEITRKNVGVAIGGDDILFRVR